MGGRGSFADVKSGDFSFIQGGQTYHSLGVVDNVKVLIREFGLSVKAPEYSHTSDRTYAVIQNGMLKHLAFYDADHKQIACIDFGHSHNGMRPHKHINLDHSDRGIPPTDSEIELANKIRRRFGVR